MPLYRTRLFEAMPNWGMRPPKPPFKARGWTADYRSFKAIDDGSGHWLDESVPPDRLSAVVHTEAMQDGRRRIIYAPEVLIEARNRLAAQRAANLISAAKTLLDGDFLMGEAFTVVPDDPADLEDLRPDQYEEALRASICAGAFGMAAELAAKATRHGRWKLGLVKYWLSLRTCSVPAIDLHPQYGDLFTVETDPINHAIMAQAIIAGYSAIEELDLQVKASSQKPSRLPNKEWNPPVLADLQERLRAAGIDLDRSIGWHIRNSPTRIDRRHPPPPGKKASWAAYSVRDRIVRITDAIGYASTLRSRVSAHGSHALTRSLTINDVHNVQHLARRLLLESMGYWDRLVDGGADRDSA